jgi:hypothetical protein
MQNRECPRYIEIAKSACLQGNVVSQLCCRSAHADVAEADGAGGDVALSRRVATACSRLRSHKTTGGCLGGVGCGEAACLVTQP